MIKSCLSTTREACVICRGPLDPLYTYNDFPIYMGVADEEEILQDQVWVICRECQCIQLKKLIDHDVLYKKPHNPAIGKTWEAHNTAYAHFINSLCDSSDSILDIGGGNCRLARQILKANKVKDYIIYDKHRYEGGLDIKFRDEFFNPETHQNEDNYNVIISSHFVEHMYDPQAFAKCFHDNLPDGGLVIFSFPHITNILKDKLTSGFLSFEHTYQIDPDYLSQIMVQHGFVCEKSSSFSPYNSFMAFRKKGTATTPNFTKNENCRRIFNNFIEYHTKNTRTLSHEINQYENKFLFGCHVFSQHLLYFGLSEGDFIGIIDNDKNKIGNKLYGTNLMTYPSSTVKDLKDVAVIVQAGIYTQEISEGLLSYNTNCAIIS